MSDKVTTEGSDLIKKFIQSDLHVQKLVKQLEEAKANKVECEQNLGTWLTPGDAVDGENFCVWFGDSLVRATVCMTGPKFRIHIRKRGESLILL